MDGSEIIHVKSNHRLKFNHMLSYSGKLQCNTAFRYSIQDTLKATKIKLHVVIMFEALKHSLNISL